MRECISSPVEASFLAEVPERGARSARRDNREYCAYVREEQRREPRCPTRGFGEVLRFQGTRGVVGIVAGLLVSAPAQALACAVCGFVGTGSNTWAYQAMTAALSLLPLAMIGTIVWWLARVAARADTERSSAKERVVDHPPRVGIENALSWREQAPLRALDVAPNRTSTS
jgi:hypothetical protein